MAGYQLAREHSRAVRVLIDAASAAGFADLVTQFRKSAASIPANILEGFGEWRPGKRLNYLMIAKGSTFESWAHADTMVDFGLLPESAVEEVHVLQGRLNGLLIKTIRAVEAESVRSTLKRKPEPKPNQSVQP
jgi:four helix bundle protein